MAKSKIKWRVKGFEEVRRLPGVKAELSQIAESMADSLGDGFVAEVGEGKTRSRAAVIAASTRARRRNARDNTILRELGARGRPRFKI